MGWREIQMKHDTNVPYELNPERSLTKVRDTTSYHTKPCIRMTSMTPFAPSNLIHLPYVNHNSNILWVKILGSAPQHVPHMAGPGNDVTHKQILISVNFQTLYAFCHAEIFCCPIWGPNLCHLFLFCLEENYYGPTAFIFLTDQLLIFSFEGSS